jgi:hypothetical protein
MTETVCKPASKHEERSKKGLLTRPYQGISTFGILLLFLSLHLFVEGTAVSAASDFSVTLRLDRREATISDTVQAVVVVTGTREGNIEPRLLGTEGFRVSKGHTSSRLQIVNGKVDASAEHTFFLVPERTGTFTIGPAEVTVEGRTLRSNTVGLQVAEAARSEREEKGSVFLVAEVSPQTVYVEQQVVYTLRLYRRVRVSDLSLTLPETKDLVFKELGEPTEYESVYNGRRYQVVEVRYRIMPSKAGVYRMEPARMRMRVYDGGSRRGGGFFDDPFFSGFATGRQTSVAGNRIVLQVLKLPEQNRPARFSGLVGEFNISAGLSPSQVEAGESATFTVVVTGQGNVNRIPDLTMPEIDGLKVYADQPVLETEVRGDGLVGNKTMKWALVPEREDTYEIPPLSVSFFNPEREQYDVLSTLALELVVLPGKDETDEIAIEPQIGRAEGPEKAEVETLGRDILPIHTSVKALHDGGMWNDLPVYVWGVLIGPAILWGAVFLSSRIRNESESAVRISRSRRAAKMFEKACAGDSSAKGCYEAFRNYLNDRLGLSLGSVTPGEAADILASRGVDADTTKAAEVLLQRIEDAIYAGNLVEWGPEDCAEACRLVKDLEKKIG